MRLIIHPGPAAPERVTALPCKATPVQLTLHAGQSLADAVPNAFLQAGFDFGYLRLDGSFFAPLTFVTPGPAPDDSHAAWYSDTHRFNAAGVRHGGVHLGLRDGKPFLHCHGVWDSPDAVADAGHLLCEDSVLAQDCTVSGWGIIGAGFVGCPDHETNFTLFRPKVQAATCHKHAFLITLRPNQDIGAALVAFARQQHIQSARIEGIGSLVGTRFEKGQDVESFATEILILAGQIASDTVRLQVASVGFDGRAKKGMLAQDTNAICVTAEVLMICEKPTAQLTATVT
ncbi:PCC domain-containing protein [Yoonia sp.]|uniref:PCC domain-containing protein n=1 Tax=Yoonia sp. TaxID=2212373 RepID=UPI00391DB8ED